jgi:hypothetical protein
LEGKQSKAKGERRRAQGMNAGMQGGWKAEKVEVAGLRRWEAGKMAYN